MNFSYLIVEAIPERRTPTKFSIGHVIGRFGAGGHLIHVLPHQPKDNQPAIVELHSLEVSSLSFGQ